jgi:hypothetical protein
VSEWEPATEAEAAMLDALRAGDQEHYFRILARVELILPVAADALAGRAPVGWGTWTADSRTHVLAFTSRQALDACLAEHAGSYRTLPFHDLASDWPDLEWWLAVNPGLPVEAYLPAWFVAQISRGDVRLPGRTLGARARIEQARGLRGRTPDAAPAEQPPPRQTATPAEAAARNYFQSSGAGDVPRRGDLLSRRGFPRRVPGATDTGPGGGIAGNGFAAPAADAPPPPPATAAAASPPPPPAPAAAGSPPRPPVAAGPPLGPPTAPAPPPSPPSAAGPPLGPPSAAAPPYAPAPAEGRAGAEGRATVERRPGAGGRAIEGRAVEGRAAAEGRHGAEGRATPPAAEGRATLPMVAGRAAAIPVPPEPVATTHPAQPVSPSAVERLARTGRADDPTAPPAAPPIERSASLAERSASLAEQATDPVERAANPIERSASLAGRFGRRPQPAEPSETIAGRSPGGDDRFGEPAQPRTRTPERFAEPAPPASTQAHPRPPEPFVEPVAQVHAPVPEPEPAAPPADFNPANTVEENLLNAAGDGSTDSFLSTLLLARVLVPGPTEDALANLDQWRTEQIDGQPYVVVFTSTEMLQRHLGDGTPATWVKFTQLIHAWPDEALSFAVNPGTPIGATLPGGQIVALASWADEVGLTDEPAEQAPEPEPARTTGGGPAPGPVVMQKTISAQQVPYYLERGYDRVSGFVHRASEVAHLRTPADLYNALGLNYSDSPFKPDDAQVYVLRWSAHRGNLYRIPYGGQHEAAMHAMQGWVIERPPFRGNGFAPSESRDVIAEFKVDSVRLPHGAELWRVDRDGNDKLIAMFDGDGPRWQRVGEE